MTAVLYGDADGVAELLKLGKWVDKPDSQGLTPLMSAVQKGDARTAELLLKGGADPNLSSNAGASAGSIARERRDGAMLALLQQHGLR
jgi:ankyrin repeat protein